MQGCYFKAAGVAGANLRSTKPALLFCGQRVCLCNQELTYSLHKKGSRPSIKKCFPFNRSASCREAHVDYVEQLFVYSMRVIIGWVRDDYRSIQRKVKAHGYQNHLRCSKDNLLVDLSDNSIILHDRTQIEHPFFPIRECNSRTF